MATGRMWFGNYEYMTWVSCPNINADLTQHKWRTTGRFVDGGGYARSSVASTRDYSLAWGPASQDELAPVLDILNGVYTDTNVVYMLDPFAMDKNILPLWMSAPYMAATDAPSLDDAARPARVGTASPGNGHPTYQARYTLSGGSLPILYRFPLPPNYTMWFGAQGITTGTAAVNFNSSAATLITPGSTTRYNTSVAGGSTGAWVPIQLAGTGTLTLTSMQAVVVPTGTTPPNGVFISGKGNSGLALSDDPVITGYSVALTNSQIGISANFIEVGAWAL